MLNVAGGELSLAWKLHPQGKDLYDAALLAGSARLRYEVLRDIFAAGDIRFAERPIGPDSVPAETEWHHFAAEYPQSAGEESDHRRRLAAALAPTFAEVPDAERADWWREGWLAPVRRLHAEDGFAAAQTWLAAHRPPLALAHRLTTEALGPAAPDNLAEAMLGCPAWSWYAERISDVDLPRETLDHWPRF
ncbi:hypothetical protein [Kitasatospora griseola]|uniref:hypothetical protein n=1 Tax=Kitasatospora griseola TaxID=2064 RepID=UPI003817D820